MNNKTPLPPTVLPSDFSRGKTKKRRADGCKSQSSRTFRFSADVERDAL